MKIVKYISLLILPSAFVEEFHVKTIASNALVVMSILFGFSSTTFSLTIFSSSAKRLYAKTSNISKTNEFYDVISVYKKTFFFNLLSIILLMFSDILYEIIKIVEYFINGYSYLLNSLLNLIVLVPICSSLYLFIKIIELNINFAVFTIRARNTPKAYD